VFTSLIMNASAFLVPGQTICLIGFYWNYPISLIKCFVMASDQSEQV